MRYITLLLFISSCTGTKFLNENQKFYTGAEIEFKGRYKSKADRQLKLDMEELLFPKPNTTILGSRPLVWVHFVAGTPKKEKGLRHWLKYKFGKEPVFFSEVDYRHTAELMNNKMHNEGFFENDVEYQVKESKKTARVIYTIVPGRPYHVGEITYESAEDPISKALEELKPASLISTGSRYRLDDLASERTRLKDGLKNKGFYYIDENHLIFDVDTTAGDRQVDVMLRKKSNIPAKAENIYRISDVFVVQDQKKSDSSVRAADTLFVDSVYYYDPGRMFRPGAVLGKVNLKPGNLYTQNDHNFTIGKLINLNAFRYVNVNFSETGEEGKLDAMVHLIPAEKKSLRVELQGAINSNDYVGPLLRATFQNRNFLRGAEVFELSLTAGFETQIYGGQQSGSLTSFELGAGASLVFPDFVLPVPFDFRNSRFVPQTEVRLGVKRINRVNFFSMSSVDLGFGYRWNETVRKKHVVFPIDISVVNLTSTTEEFRELLEINSFLRSSYEEQFILGSRYSYFYNTQAQEKRGSIDDFYFNGNIDLSGNIAYLLQSSVSSNPEGDYSILGSEYSQFAKVDVDFRYYRKISSKSKLATRVIAGAGYAYGNSESLPFIKQFSIGGSGSIRAFRARSIGPGSYRDPSVAQGGIFIDQTGDIKFEWNTEYRFDILGSLKGALFADVGNIWTIREDENRPGSHFAVKNFISEMAMGAGFGIRYDANFFVIRFDLAVPLREPFHPLAERWVFNDIGFDKVVYNIAIGYPF